MLVLKENRAVPLVRQILSELSPEARAGLVLGDDPEEAVPEMPAMLQPSKRQRQICQRFSAGNAEPFAGNSDHAAPLYVNRYPE